MKKEFNNFLVCPVTKSKLNLQVNEFINDRVKSGKLISESDNSIEYPIIDYIPRFVPLDNYANNFGYQWNIFKKTQFDSYSNQPITYNRFWKATKWDRNKMNGKLILDAGCGSGRFAEISIQTNAIVIAIDYSNAVDAAYKNFQDVNNLFLIQADVYNMPFLDETFDYVYSLGVLQHTPNVEKSLYSLIKVLKPNGFLCVDFYWKRIQTMLHMKYIFRPITKKIDHKIIYKFIKHIVPICLPISNFLLSIPYIGKALSRIIPVANYSKTYNLNKKQQIDWSILDTFDWFSPEYDNPQTKGTINKWFKKYGIKNYEIFHEGHLVGTGKKHI